ncbi:hypothetical protein AAFF_G00140150 [Aldrovandia affinis]|uniref:Uncharacterized protein n=1 Tax=Aldrovandia affinis TaxID=143900 RepID=A0AAD7TCA7_9TELE|nr:hypothetical protein AAFF_G00140150 [Aldrovandia affinis]
MWPRGQRADSSAGRRESSPRLAPAREDEGVDPEQDVTHRAKEGSRVKESLGMGQESSSAQLAKRPRDPRSAVCAWIDQTKSTWASDVHRV